jgi:cytosine/adenosine deaminase-related metal-dependent hydrolase
LLKSLGWIRSNAWFAHSIYLNDAEIAEMGGVGCGITHCPSSNMRLGSGIAHIREMLAAGVNVSLGVDGSASNDSSNMLLDLRNAMLLSRLREKENWLTADEILWMTTRGGAAVLGRDDIGQLAVGKCAD